MMQVFQPWTSDELLAAIKHLVEKAGYSEAEVVMTPRQTDGLDQWRVHVIIGRASSYQGTISGSFMRVIDILGRKIADQELHRFMGGQRLADGSR